MRCLIFSVLFFVWPFICYCINVSSTWVYTTNSKSHRLLWTYSIPLLGNTDIPPETLFDAYSTHSCILCIHVVLEKIKCGSSTNRISELHILCIHWSIGYWFSRKVRKEWFLSRDTGIPTNKLTETTGPLWYEPGTRTMTTAMIQSVRTDKWLILSKLITSWSCCAWLCYG